MANVVFRLPGREQYSYAEVTFTAEETETLSAPEVETILFDALERLNATYPQSAAPAPQGGYSGPQDARPGDPRTTCNHGARKHSKGRSGKGPWQALFCTQPKGSACDPVWLKEGDPLWQN